MNTIVNKGMRGTWQAETFLPFNAEKQLRISTLKNHRGNLVTNLAVVKVIQGNGYQSVEYTPFSDYNVQAEGTQDRCTKANVEAQHSKVLGEIEHYRAEALKHYEEKAK